MLCSLCRSTEMPIDADAAAHAKHQEILTAIERLRVDAAQAMTDGDFSPPVVTEEPNKDQKKAFVKMHRHPPESESASAGASERARERASERAGGRYFE